MIDESSTLADVCFAVSTALSEGGIDAVLVGGSAAAVYAPQRYISYDADFVLRDDDMLDDVATVLSPLGYRRDGRSRIFVHATSKFTVDFPKGPLAVGGDYVRDTVALQRGSLRLELLTVTDCVRDRLAHFYHWNDYSALDAAVGVASAARDRLNHTLLREWTVREGAEFLPKLQEFEERLRQDESSQ